MLLNLSPDFALLRGTGKLTLILVVSLSVQSSKRMVNPTVSPSKDPFSSATRDAKETAATLLGSVTPIILPSSHQPAS
ncbi:unnamed protein product, partial [Nesidiocoris tenuis]